MACVKYKRSMDLKGSQIFENRRVKLGVAYSKGGRDYMQDIFSVDLDQGIAADSIPVDFMGVMDGHGPNGENIAMFVAHHLCDTVLELYKKGHHFLESIEMACLVLDEKIRLSSQMMDKNGQVMGGSTCNAIWIRQKKIYSCNVGDCRFILSYKGKAFAVTEDHKPDARREKQRIFRAGGFVNENRVNGILGVARSFGDFVFKSDLGRGQTEQLVTALPDVFTVEIDPNIDFMVLASDGVWDVLTNQQVVDFIEERIHKVMPLNRIATLLIELCNNLVPTWCGMGSDNLTCIIATIKNK